MVRYLDTGSRDPSHALGSWLGELLLGKDPVAAVRVQTGFFAAGVLGYFEETLQRLTRTNGHTSFLIGSNNGMTQRSAMDDLLTVAGPPRSNMHITVACFQGGYFHPKVFHFKRTDGSAASYVGSANLTLAGVRSQNIEAGITLDTREGDDDTVLSAIAQAIDGRFNTSDTGFHPVTASADLDELVSAGIIGRPVPERSTWPPTSSPKDADGQQAHPFLYPLVAVPVVKAQLPPEPPDATGPERLVASLTHAPDQRDGQQVAHWSKKLSASDAQRKASGNQSGAVALTQGDYRHKIDQTTYFRSQLFGDQVWNLGTTATGEAKEVAKVPLHVTIDGHNHGTLEFEVSSALNRESGQHNYTAQLHLEPISPLFRQADMTGKLLEVERYDNGSYWLTIS